jgi:hypothetical protein
MLSIRSAGALVVLALAAAPLAPAHASADGCVTQFLKQPSPGLGGTVVLNPDGSVTVNPNPALGVAGALAGSTQAFVACVV